MSWQADVREALRSQGFSSLDELLRTHPGESYEALANLFPSSPLVLPVMLIRLQLEDARLAGAVSLRSAFADSLARTLAAHLPDGWGQTKSNQADVSPDFMNIAAWSTWVALVSPEDDSQEALFARLWESLRAKARLGWRPTSENDPVLQEVFNEAWPEPSA